MRKFLLTTSLLFGLTPSAFAQVQLPPGVQQSGTITSGHCLKQVISNTIADAGANCGGTGAPAGSTGQVQYNAAGSFGGMTGYTYTAPGTTDTLTGADGTTWSTGGIQIGSASKLNINGTVLLSGSAPVMWVPACSSGAGGATWLIGPGGSATTGYCANTTSAATDNICIGTITCGSQGGSITSGEYNVAMGSENLKVITTATNGTCIGFEACHVVTSGVANTGIGNVALSFVTTGNNNVALGSGAGEGLSVGAASNVCIFSGCGANNANTGSNNVIVGGGGGTLTTGSRNIIIGSTNNDAAHGIATGHGNVWIGAQNGTALSDPSDSITIADGDGNELIQYLPANAVIGISQPITVTGSITTTSGGIVSGAPTGGAKGTGTFNGTAYYLNGALERSSTAPTVSGSGLGSSPSVTGNAAAMDITVGTSPSAATFTITLPTATNGWVCTGSDITTNSTTVFVLKQTGTQSATTCVMGIYTDAAVLGNAAASDHLRVSATAY